MRPSLERLRALLASPTRRALAARDLWRYFGNPTGYVFITLFILLSGAAAFWQPQFFLRNIADLTELNDVFPYLLVLFIPALTMTVWAEERKLGTDELLLTLPATETEIVAGKYAAVLGIYTIAVLLSLSHVAVLAWLGSPDTGLIAANYFGYWLLGAALIPVGMLASPVTANATVAFILAIVLCGVPVLIEPAARAFGETWGRRVAPFGLLLHFNDFSRGVISVAGVFYCCAIASFFLYLNVLVLSRRHWKAGDLGGHRARHYSIRVTAVAVTVVALTSILARAGLRVDSTSERVHSLGPETRKLLQELPADRPVVIRAFVSSQVPQEYTKSRESLLGLLREMQAMAGGKVQLSVEPTDPYSQAAREARERFGILARRVTSPDADRTEADAVIMGVAVTAGAEEQVIPFLEPGQSAEYELTRAVRMVARTSRKRIGVVDTDAGILGGFDFESGRPRARWAIVEELRKQYDLVPITPYDPITERLDALIVMIPSTLLQAEMDNVLAAIEAGTPALVVVDPLPALDMRLAPAAPMAARLNQFADPTRPLVRKNTGDILKFMMSIGVDWPATRVVWDSYAPHPEMGQLPKEMVFVARNSGGREPFNPRHVATAGLQELMLLYPGHLRPATGTTLTMTPLIQTSNRAGTNSYFTVVQPSPGGMVLNVNAPHNPENQELVLAAEIRGQSRRAKPLRAIVIADLDFVSNQAFEMRAATPEVMLDNIEFFLNCVDVLSGDEAFIGLRNRRQMYRPLARVEAQTRIFLDRRTREEQTAEGDAQKAIDAAQQRLNDTVRSIATRTDLDAQSKEILARNVQETEQRRFEQFRRGIQEAKGARIQASRETMEAEVRRIQSAIRTVAVLLPPLPIVAIALVVFLRRRRRERQGAAALRRLKDVA